MKAADVSNRIYRDSVDGLDPASSQQSPHSWTAVQILTPILVTIFLSLSFILYLQHKKGRLSRLTSILFMRGRRQARRARAWTTDSRLADREFDQAPDAEATPMINSPHHWTSPRDATDHHRLSPRIRERMMTISTAIRSVTRLFGGGPIRVSRAPISDDFDIEDSDPEMDPFVTLRSNASSRARRNRPPTVRRSTSDTDGEAPIQVQASETRLDLDLDDVGVYDGDETNVVRDSGVDDHDSKMVTGNGVMLISRNGQNFSLTSNVISMRRSPMEVDRRSIEVVPPTPTLNNQPFRIGAYHARSASTPHLHCPTPHAIPLRSLSPCMNDLSGSHSHRSPELSVLSPLPISAAPSSWRPSRAEAHYYTAATPPIDSAAGSTAYRSPRMVGALSISPGASPEQRSRRRPTDASSPPVSPHLQNYAPSFPDSPRVPPSSVPSSLIPATDPQNLIPSAVRGAGYNPFQHSRSTSDLGLE
ncbi:hypothetical protein BJV78DRAFT_448494 [Lactifluus subvellereus]|nr:hypothetical protein BJV78DRAFT_448494 [Lactifluus subvellereus]